MTLSITLDERTEAGLRQMSDELGQDEAVVAARLVTRAVLMARPKPVYDTEALKALYTEFEEEDMALAESDAEHRQALLEYEDNA